jgi:hypothetical protein
MSEAKDDTAPSAGSEPNAAEPAAATAAEASKEVPEALSLERLVSSRFPDAAVGQILPHARALRALLGQSEPDFLLRFAVTEELARSPRTRWTREAMDSALHWIPGEHRDRTLSSLRRGGWLERVAGSELRLTQRGASLLTALSELFGVLPGDEGELALGVLRLEWADAAGVAPGPLLRHLLHQVHRVLDDVERALSSRSEAAIADAGRRLEVNLEWAVRARQTMEKMKIEGEDALAIGRSLGRALARLHQGVGRLQIALNALGRGRIPLGASGLTLADVAAFIGRADPELLAELGANNVHQPVRPRLCVVDNLLTDAESALCRDAFLDGSEATHGWERAMDAPALDDAGPEAPITPEQDPLAVLSADLVRWAIGPEPVPLDRAVAGQRFAECAHRLAMLVLGEEGVFPFDSEAGTKALEETGRAPGERATVPAVRLDVPAPGDLGEPMFSEGACEVSSGAVRAWFDVKRKEAQKSPS